MPQIEEIKGNIFNSDCQTLVNTVNCKGFMGKGIAFEFKHRFPEMYEVYKKVCDRGYLKPGKLQLYKKSDPWILNFPTKNDWKHPSKIEYIEKGMEKFSTFYKEKDINSIAFPKLGTSQGGLEWGEVRKVMFNYLEDLENLKVEIYHYDPKVKDKLFEEVENKFKKEKIKKLRRSLKMNSRKIKRIQKIIGKEQASSIPEFTEFDGIGERTIEKIYNYFLKNNDSSEGQQRLISK